MYAGKRCSHAHTQSNGCACKSLLQLRYLETCTCTLYVWKYGNPNERGWELLKRSALNFLHGEDTNNTIAICC